MKKEFKIFKEGTTSKKITIFSDPSTGFDRKKKIKFYLSLGYEVFDMDDKKIN